MEIIPTHIDIIARKHGLTTKETLTQLLDLELEGIVTQYPGKRFSRTRL